ncbi:MAG: right-handed parallel beta-helix repeat-containing protein [Halobacteriota archaeon]
MHKIVAPLLGFVITCLLLSTLSVSVNGAALNVGSGGQYKSITEAVNTAQSGDTITISAGTYTENIIVTKSVTIKAASPGSTIVTAADPSKDVFLVQAKNVRVEGLTITGATGASGVHVDHSSACVVTGISAHKNNRAIYLDGATNCEVSSNNLADNGYGVYCDNASNNTISSNIATGEQGGGTALGDGIYMYYSDANTITHTNLSANHVFGISLYHSSGNTISNNSILNNQDIGVRLRESNNNTLTFNTVSGNVNLGILSITETGDQIYLNNFINQPNSISDVQGIVLNSPQQLPYTFGGATHIGYMGNYFSDYKGSDANGTGIGSPASVSGDKYPLVQPFEKYTNIGAATAGPSSTSATSFTSASTTSTQPSNLTNAAVQTSTPGFGVEGAFLAIALIASILAYSRVRHR